MSPPGERFDFDAPAEARQALVDVLEPVGSERVPSTHAVGRVLAAPLRSDRDSPACDVSAMDGYALRLADVRPGRVEVAAEVVTGEQPPPLPEGRAARIFTGGAVPDEAEVVVKREDVEEWPESVVVPDELHAEWGQNIRRRGENLDAGSVAVEAGNLVDAPVAAVATTFGATEVEVHRAVRVGVIVTGDEVRPPGSAVAPWELRDANGPGLEAWLTAIPWVDCLPVRYVPDDRRQLVEAVDDACSRCDAVLLSGGVSMGDHDHVPTVVEDRGAKVVFHRLPLRPGKPLLGAVGPDGQAILGLPGNPVSVLVTARVLAIGALRRRAGFTDPSPRVAQVELTEWRGRQLDLWWYRTVRLTAAGRAELVASRGSGDIVSAAAGDGVVEVAPGVCSTGPFPFYGWSA